MSDLITRLIAAGTPADLVAEVAMLAARAEVEREAIESRRKSDRERQASRRAAQKAEDVTVCHVTSRDVADVTGQTPPSPSPLPSPCTPNHPPAPTHPVCISRVREEDRVSEAVDLWNAMASRTGLSRVSRLTEDRRKKIRARLADASWEQFTEAIAAVERSPFCRGDSTDGWRADFDFLLQPKSFNRLIEGSYDRASSRNGTAQRVGGNSGSGSSSGGKSSPLDAAERWLARRAAQ